MCASMLSPVWLCKPMDCNLPDSFIRGIFQARTLECCHFLLQGIFLSQGLNLNLLHWKADSLPLHHLGSPWNISSVQFNHSVMSDSLQPHGVQHTRPPCPSATPVVYSNSCPLNWWCHPTISSSVVPFCSRLHSFPASESFQMSQFFSSGGQSFSFNISPFSEYSGLILFRMDWLDLLAVQGTLLNNYQLMIAKCSLNYRQM